MKRGLPLSLGALLLAASLSAASRELPSPAAAGAAEAFLSSGRNGDLLLSWLEPAAKKGTHALRFARWSGTKWSAPRTIVERGDLFVNWADFPSLVETPDGLLFAHWLQRSGGSTYAYDVRLSVSRDGGKSWAPSIVLHDDRSKVEHGFVSLEPKRGGVDAVWLDGRKMKEGSEEGEMTLRSASVDASLRISRSAELDARVCDCCTTATTRAADALVVAYRDRSASEVRDVSVVRAEAKGWSAPKPLHHDGWTIAGCPVNGPQLASRGLRVAAAWFTAPGDAARVNVAFSRDGGRTFGEPTRVDGGGTLGRVDVAFVSDGEVVVVWLEGAGTNAKLMARNVSLSGKASAPRVVASVSAARASGFPRLAIARGSVYLAWNDAGESRRVHVMLLQ